VRRAASLLVAATLGCVPSSVAGPAPPALEQAIESYALALQTGARDARLEEFRRAERLFARVLESGVESPDLYANLGNAALQVEHLGSAVLAYRRALRLDPDHARALRNLEHARGLLPGWVSRSGPAGAGDGLLVWQQRLSGPERSSVAALCFALAASLVAAALRLDRPGLRRLALLPALMWGALLAAQHLELGARSPDEAVVVADELVARAADGALAPSAFPAPLPSGAEVRVLEERSAWVRIRLADGRDGWVGRSGISRVSRAP
jgi:hypothetical protein